MIGFRKVWGSFEGVSACFGGSRWVKGGLLDPYRAHFAHSGSLVQHQIRYQTLCNGSTGQGLLGRHH